MIDVPVVERARHLLDRETAIANREAQMRTVGLNIEHRLVDAVSLKWRLR